MKTKKVKFEVIENFGVSILDENFKSLVIPKGTIMLYNCNDVITETKFLREIKQRRIKDKRSNFEKLINKYSERFFGVKIKFEKTNVGTKTGNIARRDNSLQLDFDNKEEEVNQSNGSDIEQTL